MKNTTEIMLNTHAKIPVNLIPNNPTSSPCKAPIARTLDTIIIAIAEAILSINVFIAENIPSLLTPLVIVSCWMMSDKMD